MLVWLCIDFLFFFSTRPSFRSLSCLTKTSLLAPILSGRVSCGHHDTTPDSDHQFSSNTAGAQPGSPVRAMSKRPPSRQAPVCVPIISVFLSRRQPWTLGSPSSFPKGVDKNASRIPVWPQLRILSLAPVFTASSSLIPALRVSYKCLGTVEAFSSQWRRVFIRNCCP